MRVHEIRERFGLDRLVLAERPERRPAPGQVVLAMRAVSLNYRDLLTVRGEYNPRQPLPLVPCSDGVGEVVEVGEGVHDLRAGDRVATCFAQKWLSGVPTREKLRSTLGGPLDGTLAERMALDATGVVKLPAFLTAEEGATLPCAGLTAWSALVGHGGVRPGDTVLLLGTGGVSIFALQFAGILGARCIILSSSDEKLARARELGAWETLNYRACPEWGAEVKRLTGGRGVDLVVEVGGANTLARSVRAVAFGGTVAIIGTLSGGNAEFSPIPVLMQQLRLQGVLVGHREGFEAMNRAIEANAMRPVVDRVFGFGEARAAFEHLAEGRHFGKVCIRI